MLGIEGEETLQIAPQRLDFQQIVDVAIVDLQLFDFVDESRIFELLLRVVALEYE